MFACSFVEDEWKITKTTFAFDEYQNGTR